MPRENHSLGEIVNSDNLLIDLHFAPSLFYIWLLWNAGHFKIEACENYNKRSFRNKCFIKSNIGSQLISVPLAKGKNSQKPIRDIEISYSEDWIRILRNTLQSEFGKSPYFEYYFTDIMEIFDNHFKYLFALNKELLSYFCSAIQTSGINWSDNFIKEPNPPVEDLRERITPKLIKSVPWLHSYCHIDFFEINPGHSIIETLFQYGPETGYLLQKMGGFIQHKIEAN